MGEFLAALSSLIYGTSDFLGGVASKRNDGVVVTFFSQACGFVALLIAVALWPDVTVSASDLWWGVGAGIAGGVGLMFFYPALAVGPMSVVAPTTALCSASVPLAVGLLLGERPHLVALVGVLLALPAIVLVAREHHDHPVHVRRFTIVSAVTAGFGFGGFFVLLSRADSASGMWPLVGARIGSLSMLAVVLLVSRRPWRIATGTWRTVVSAGVGDVTANGLYLLAVGRGLLSVVAVVGSMYPASTVLLARFVLHERLQRVQIAGLALAGASLALVAIGR